MERTQSEKVRRYLKKARGERQTHAQAVSRLLSRLEVLQQPILASTPKMRKYPY